MMDKVEKWRLILGKKAEDELKAQCGLRALGQGLGELDAALGAIYDQEDGDGDASKSARQAGLGSSAPRLAKWLGDIRSYFPRDVVAVIQQDAIERKGLQQLLFEPETLAEVTPSVELVGTLLALKGMIPETTKETARMVVRAVVEEIVRRLQSALEAAVRGALDRSRHSPLRSLANLDFKRTIARNLRNWDRGSRRLIADRLSFWARHQRRREWTVIVCMDQSGSMADSVVYGSVTGAILASMPALRTHTIVFDTEVVDLTDRSSDPVDLLFGVQLGGGTDINRAVKYCESLIVEPRKTLFLLITDLYEGGSKPDLLRRLAGMAESGVRALTLLALSDSGVPSYDEGLARQVRALGIPCFGCTPGVLPELLAGALKGADLERLAGRIAAGKGGR